MNILTRHDLPKKVSFSFLYCAAIVLCTLIFYTLLIHGKIYGQGDVDVYLNYGTIIHQTFSEYHTLPLWQHTLSGGFPLYAFPEVPQFEIAHLLYAFIPTPLLALNLSILFYLIIAGIGMFLFVNELEQKKGPAFLASIVYIFTGNMLVSIFTLPFFYATTLIPLVFYFLLKAFRSEQIKTAAYFALLAALAWSMQILSGGSIIFLWTAVGVGLFSLYFFVLKSTAAHKKKELMAKFFLVGFVLVLFTILFSAIKLLPSAEIKELSQRNARVPTYDEFVWEHTQIKGDQLVNSVLFKNESRIYLGPVVALLMLASVINIKKPHTFFFWILTIIALLIEIGTPLTHLMYNIPILNETRQIYNVLVLFSLTAAVLAANGLGALLKKIRLPSRAQNAAPILIGFLILVMTVQNFSSLTYVTYREYEDEISQNSMLQSIKSDEGIFRIHHPAQNFVGASIVRYTVPLKLQTSEWTTTNLWFPEYVVFNQIAGAQLDQTAKWWGIQNVKYVTSPVLIDEQKVPGLKLAQTFEPCSSCTEQLVALYKNEKFLPRAYFVNSSILIVDSDIMWVTYDIMLQNYFDPGKVALEIDQSQLKNFNIEQLSRYDAVIVVDRKLPREAEQLLGEYEAQNGIVVTNILTQEWVDFKTKAGGDVKKFLEKKNPLTTNLSYLFEPIPENNVKEAQLTMTPTQVTAQIKEANHQRFLVISDRYSRFEGWKVEFNGKELLFQNANVVASMVEVPQGETGTLVLSYKPKRFVIGLSLTVLALLFTLFFTFYKIRSDRKKTNGEFR